MRSPLLPVALAASVLGGIACTSSSGTTSAVPSPVSPTASLSVAPSDQPAKLESFDACIGMKQGRCRNERLYLAGDRPQIVATVRPADVADAMTLWRKDGRHPWERVTSVTVDESGRAAWRWQTSDADIRNAPWSYRYTIPDIGHSDIVRIRIIAPDF